MCTIKKTFLEFKKFCPFLFQDFTLRFSKTPTLKASGATICKIYSRTLKRKQQKNMHEVKCNLFLKSRIQNTLKFFNKKGF